MNRIIELIKGTRLGQAFDNLLRETSGDGFKSKCVVASYLSVAQCGLVSFIIVLIMLVIYAVGVFTNVPVAGDIMIEFLKIVKDILFTMITFFAIAVTTTFGATAFGIQSPSANTKIDNIQAPTES